MSQSVTGMCRPVDRTQTKTTRTRFRVITRMEDVSFWLAIVLLVSLHSLYDPGQHSGFEPAGPGVGNTQAPAIRYSGEGQPLKSPVAEQNRSAG